jgi:hypothetical protein
LAGFASRLRSFAFREKRNYNEFMSLRPQDVVVAVKLALLPQGERPTYPDLAAALGLSLSEAHGAVKRATAAGLVSANRKANRAALVDFLVQGVSSAFIPKRGPLTRGVPTAHGAPPLDELVGSTAEPPPVWPDPDGTVRGETFEPLYPSVPRAAKKDPKLYQALCLIDAIRIGRSRDRALAEEHLRKLLLPTSEPSTSKRFSLDEPRRAGIVRALEKTIGPGTAMFYRSAVRLLELEPPVEATSHLVAHLATQIDGSVRDVIAAVMDAETTAEGRGSGASGQTKQSRSKQPDPNSHANSIRSVLTWLGVPADGQIGDSWLGLTGKDNEAGLAARRHRQNLEPPRPIDRDFWERFEGILDEVLGAFEKRYASVFDRLDQLLAKAQPNEEDAKALRGMLPQTPIALGYFFGRLSNPAWIEPLDKVGFFSRPPEPIRDATSVEYPSWPALFYLARMVDHSPEAVARIALAVPPTENVEVHATLAEIARALPARLSEPFVDKVDDWLTRGKRSHAPQRLAGNIIGLLEKIVADGGTETALRLLAMVLQPTRPEEGENDRFLRRRPEIRLATWDLRKTMEKLSPPALALGERGLDVVAESLELALAMTRVDRAPEWFDDSARWCHEVETHTADHLDHLLAHLVCLTRDTAVRILDARPSSLSRIVTSFEKRRWPIFRRLALFLLHKHSSGFSDLVAKRLVERSCFELAGPEYSRLLRSCFSHLAEDQRRTILSWIEEGSGSSDSSGHVERRTVRWLGVVASALPEDWRSKYEALRAKVGDVPAMDEVPPDDTLVLGPTSPFRDEVLARMSPSELVDTVQSWKPSFEFDGPEPEDLSRKLASLVEQKPEVYAAAAEDLKRLDPTFLRGMLNGFDSAARIGRAFDWKPVSELCAWTVSRPRQIPDRSETPFGFDTHWGHAQHRALMLLSTGLTSHIVPIPVELRNIVWSAVQPTLDDPDDAEGLGDVDDNPMDHLLVHIQGLAMITAIEYAIWLARGKHTKSLPEEVRTALEEKIRAGSVAVRVALADRVSSMAGLDGDWTQSQIPPLFKPDDHGRDFAWETYLQRGRLTLEVFHWLRWRYGAAIDELSPEANLDHRRQELAHLIGNDLGRLYWHGQLAFGEKDRLLERFFEKAPAKSTGELIEDLGHWLDTDGQPSPEVLARLKALWARRAEIGRPEELAAFAWWFSCSHFEEGWAIDAYLDTLKALERTGFQPEYAPKIGEQLTEMISQHLPKVMSCLEILVKANESGWAILDLRPAIRAVLAAVRASGDSDLKRLAKATVSRLARRGYPELRELL